MAHRLLFEPAIPGDLAGALDYYEEISPTLANRFRRSVNQCLDRIAKQPESFPFDIQPIRFAKVGRFPYLILFVVKPNFVSLIAIVHGSSKPERWRERL